MGVLVLKSQTLYCLVWCRCQETFSKYFCITLWQSHFSMVITQNKNKILVSNQQIWHIRNKKPQGRVTKDTQRTQMSNYLSTYTCKAIPWPTLACHGKDHNVYDKGKYIVWCMYCWYCIALYTVCIVLYRVVINVSQVCDSEIMKSIKSGGVWEKMLENFSTITA